jgi:hypothetical protein
MRARLLLAACGIAGAFAFGSGAFAATVVISDNFGSTGAEGNWPGDGTFTSIPPPGNVSGEPSVDLVGPGFYDNLAYSGNSVDLDGSTGTGNIPAGELQSVTSLSTGDYTVKFLLAGNMRNSPDQTVAVSIGGETIDVTPTSNAQGYTPYELIFTNVSGPVEFTDLGPSNQQGDLLDNVSVTTGVPEPASWAMLLMGMAAVGAGLRLRREPTRAIARS